jgi:hypothetical protein
MGTQPDARPARLWQSEERAITGSGQGHLVRIDLELITGRDSTADPNGIGYHKLASLAYVGHHAL